MKNFQPKRHEKNENSSATFATPGCPPKTAKQSPSTMEVLGESLLRFEFGGALFNTPMGKVLMGVAIRGGFGGPVRGLRSLNMLCFWSAALLVSSSFAGTFKYSVV
uniref:Uncharacterized protein n=1 Tax=Oltmannsiellopsis viridis TaxID=51324 RepID=Q20EU2_OLTVI|nr:hypothetical protein OlviCp082 [Oltmannsiellopsis viridis]ABB81971.1 hypothetical protein [Oltmannsiellopsis viridis]